MRLAAGQAGLPIQNSCPIPGFLHAQVAVAALLVATAAAAPAADRYWSGTGTWNTTTATWGTATGGPYDAATWSNSPADAAFFEGTAGTVTLGGPITAAGLTFSTTGYTVTGNTLTLTGTPSIATGSGISATIAGTLAGGAAITKTGDGTLTLTGDNTYSGGTTVNSGTLDLGGAVNGASRVGSGTLTINAGATVRSLIENPLGFNTSAVTPGVVLNGGTWNSQAFLASFRTATLNDGTLTRSGGFWYFNQPGQITSTGTSTISGGQMRLRPAGSLTMPIQVDSGTLTISAELANDLGAAGFEKTGPGTLRLTGINSYTGATLISAGTVLADTAGALGTVDTATVGAGGRLTIANGVAFTRPLVITPGGRVNLGAGSRVALPDAAALAAFESMSPAGALTRAEILFGAGSSTPAALTSNWSAKPLGEYFSDILTLEGTGAGNTYVLSMGYAGSSDNLNVWYRTNVGDPFTPLGTSFAGNVPWNNSFTTVGQYGVDTSAGTVWAVTDHNSQFVIVPEPGTLGLLAVGLAAATCYRHRRRATTRP